MFSSRASEKTDSRYGENASPAPGERVSGPLLDPVYILAFVWRAKFFILGMAIIGTLLATGIAMTTPKKYLASTQILVDPRSIRVLQNEVTDSGLSAEGMLALIESQVSIIYSNAVLEKIVDQANLTADPEFGVAPSTGLAAWLESFGIGDEEDEEARSNRRLLTLTKLRRAMDVARDTKSFVISLAVTTRSPEKSARLSRLIAETFIEEVARAQSDTARRASGSLTARLAELRQRVVTAERAVEAYKAGNSLVGVGGRLVDDDYILRMNDQLAAHRGEVTRLRVRADQMRGADVDDVVTGTFPEELTSDALTRLRTSYTDLQQADASLSARLGPRHPERLANREALAASRSAIRAELNRIVQAAQTDLRRAEETDAQLLRQIDDLKTKQISTSGSFVRLRELEREAEASRAVYEAFLLRARETGEQEGINTANVRVISQAVPPLEPVSLSRKVVILLGFIGGLMVGTGLAGTFAAVRYLRLRQFSPARAALVSAMPATANAGSDPAPRTVFPRDEPVRAEVAAPRLDAEPESLPAANDDLAVREQAHEPGPKRGEDRAALRERVRHLADAYRPSAAPTGLDGDEDAEVLRLQNDIEAVKREITALRQRRHVG